MCSGLSAVGLCSGESSGPLFALPPPVSSTCRKCDTQAFDSQTKFTKIILLYVGSDFISTFLMEATALSSAVNVVVNASREQVWSVDIIGVARGCSR